MLSVDARADRVERDLVEGRLRCPDCDGELRPWWRGRERRLRDGSGWRRVQPRRSRCRACRRTHVLLPVIALRRRVDVVDVIGSALEHFSLGAGHRTIARRVGVPPTTVRGWLRRFASGAERIRVFFTGLALGIDASLSRLKPHGSVLADAVEAIGQAASAAATLFGPRPVWQFASGATGGMLLGNTNAPLPGM